MPSRVWVENLGSTPEHRYTVNSFNDFASKRCAAGAPYLIRVCGCFCDLGKYFTAPIIREPSRLEGNFQYGSKRIRTFQKSILGLVPILRIGRLQRIDSSMQILII